VLLQIQLAAPFPRTSSPLSAFGLEFHDFPLDNFLAMPMGSVSNQNCCKGFHFKEKVEKHWLTSCLVSFIL